jgi:hypothetical protein
MQVGGGTPLSYPQDHASRSCSVLFARYFVIVISCVVYFISSLAPDRVSLAELRLCVCHYHVAIFQLPFPGSSLVDILVVENMFLQLLSSLFCEIFFGDFNYYQSREHIHSTGLLLKRAASLNMSDDDRAAKAARAKALVRIFLSEMQPLTFLRTAQ